MYLLADSWDTVKTTTIQNCFKKGGFKKEMSNDLLQNEDPLSDVVIPCEIDRAAFEQMVDLDGEEEIFENLSDTDLLNLAASERSSKSNKPCEDEEEENEEEQFSPVKTKDFLNSVLILRKYAQQQNFDSECFNAVKMIEDFAKKEQLHNKTKGLKLHRDHLSIIIITNHNHHYLLDII